MPSMLSSTHFAGADGASKTNEFRIRFSGPMLFVTYTDRVEILIPNAEKGGTHKDKTKAKRHYAWFTAREVDAVSETAVYRAREALVETDVVFGRPADGAPSGSLGKNFSFEEMTGEVTLKHRDPLKDRRIAARVTLFGGELQTAHPSSLAWSMPKTFDPGRGDTQFSRESLAYTAVWAVKADKLVAELSFSQQHRRTVEIGPAANLYIDIANLDERVPERWEIPGPETDLAKDGGIDGDFKWTYRAMAPTPGNTWKSLIRKTKNRQLPAPLAEQMVGGGYRGGSSCNKVILRG